MMIDVLCKDKLQQKNKLISFLDDCLEKGMSSFFKLSLCDQKHAVGLLINAIDFSSEMDWIHNNKDSDKIMQSFINMMLSPSAFSEKRFIQTMKDCAVTYYENYLDEYFQEKLIEYKKLAKEYY